MRSLFLFVILAGVFFVNAPSHASAFPDLEVAKRAFKSGDLEKALQNWQPLADFGIPDAQFELGKLYARGTGVEQNNEKAFRLFHSAAITGHIRAMLELGQLYESGRGTVQDASQAESWYRRAAQNDYPRAYYYLGRLYESGTQTASLAGKSATKSAKELRYSMAAEYYQQAFQSGYLRAGQRLGGLYEKGLGVEQNNVLALAYYYASAVTGSAGGQKKADKLEAKLEESEIAQARAKSEEFLQYVQKETGKKRYRTRGSLKLQYIAEDNRDLGTAAEDTQAEFVADGKAGLYFYATDDITTFVEARALWNSGLISADTDDGDDSADDSFIELRQAWALFEEPFGHELVDLTIGRQRFDEKRNIWWNRNFDSIRLALNSTLVKGFLAIGQNLASYRTQNTTDFGEDEEDRLRVLGEYSQQWKLNHFLEGRFLYEHDYSGAENVGQLVPGNDLDDEDVDLLWVGARAIGEIPSEKNWLNKIRYRGDIMGVAGEETLVTTAASDGGFRTVTANTDRDVLGWGFDGTLDFDLDTPLDPIITVGYAFGSGDENPGTTETDHAFRQTQLDGNSGKFEGRYVDTVQPNFGEVLRPELSNLHIVTIGTNVALLDASDLSINYFRYWLDEDATDLRLSRIRAALNGTDKDVGQALDITAHIDLEEEFGFSPYLTNGSILKLRLGGFKAGDAYGAGEGEYSFRSTAEMRFRY